MIYQLKKKASCSLLVGTLALSLSPLLSTHTHANELPNVHLTEDATRYGSRIDFAYDTDQQYTVLTKLGYLTDITLNSDEEIINIMAGDTARWMVQSVTVMNAPHVYIKPITEGINTNVIILTNKRIYRLMVWSDTGTYNSVVSFTYPRDPSVPPPSAVTYSISESMTPEQKEWYIVYGQYQKDVKKETMLTTKSILQKENTFEHNYELKAKGKVDKSVYPIAVFNDDVRTYIHMPTITSGNYPIFYTITSKKKLALVNYRVRDSYIIIDRLFNEGRLYYSPTDYIVIQKTQPKEKKGVRK